MKALRRHLPLILALLALGGMALCWWSSAASTSVARIAAMQVVEPYAFAAYHQVVHNLAFSGEFFQTIHQGYDDAWTWSGHRAPALFPVAWLYRLDPTVYGLARLQILLVLLGVIPAALLGRRMAGRDLGLVVGGALYLFSPPVLSLALQDYQDLVLALPCLLLLGWALQADKPFFVPLGIVAGLLPREETVPLVLAMSLLFVPWKEGRRLRERVRWRRWGWNILVAVILVGAYALWVERAFPATDTRYEMPLYNVLSRVGGQGGMVFLDGWPFWDRFYATLLVPLGLLSLLSPQMALLAAGLVLFHLAQPEGHALDRSWSGHSHHLAPAVALLVLGAIEGAGRILRWLGNRLGPAGRVLPLLAGAGILVLIAVQFQAHARAQNLRVLLLPRNPAWVHPAWELAAMLPEDAIPAVPRDLSPMVSNREIAYTFDGSLEGKARHKGLGAATHALVDSRQADGAITRWVSQMPGARVLAESPPFALHTWEPGAADPLWAEMKDQRLPKSRPYIGRYRRRDEIPGVAPFEPPQAPAGATIPRFRLPFQPGG